MRLSSAPRFVSTSILLIGALTAGGPAFAQAPNQPAAPTASGIGEIVITARRREERLQDVPIAVTAMDSQKLREAQVTTARQLVGLVPSLNIATGNQRDFQRYTIRGQGATVGSAEGVSVYLAEAPISQYIAGGPGLYFDLQDLQVLNGPQGTLFGRNTTGGAVLFTPKRPTDANEGFIEAGLGNYNNREVGGALNWAPMPDVLRFRFSGQRREREGFTTQRSDGEDLDDINYYTLRASMLFNPNDTFENYTLAQFTRSATGGTGTIVNALNPAFAATPVLTPFLTAQPNVGIRDTQGGAPHWWHSKTFVLVNTTTQELPFNLTLKNVASFQRLRVSGGFDNDGTPIAITQFERTPYTSHPSGFGEGRNEYLTEELQLQGDWLDSKFNWVLGGFYQNSYPYGYQEVLTRAGANLTKTVSGLSSTTKAAFAQGTFDFGALTDTLDGLKLTLGYRYTWDTRDYQAASWVDSNPTKPCSNVSGPSFPNCDRLQRGEWSAPTYSVGLDYKVTDKILVYAAYRTGYKSGGINTVVNALIPQTFGPEGVKNTEVGVKADFDIGAMPVRANLAVFNDEYSDIQRSTFLQGPVSILTWLANASAAEIKGAELSVTARPTDRLQIDFNYSYLDAAYTDYLFRDLSRAPPLSNQLRQWAGKPLPFAPEHKWGASVKYTLPLDPDVGEISVNAAASYQDNYLVTDQPQPAYILGDYTLVNLGADWQGVAGSNIDAEFFVTNATDEEELAGSQIFYYSAGTNAVSYIEPRMYGVRLRYRFGD